jgi:glycosyltransferase involved in cell wall biosynthesis
MMPAEPMPAFKMANAQFPLHPSVVELAVPTEMGDGHGCEQAGQLGPELERPILAAATVLFRGLDQEQSYDSMSMSLGVLAGVWRGPVQDNPRVLGWRPLVAAGTCPPIEVFAGNVGGLRVHTVRGIGMRIVHCQLAPYGHSSYQAFTMYPAAEALAGNEVRVIAASVGKGAVWEPTEGLRICALAAGTISNYSLMPTTFAMGVLRTLRDWAREGWYADIIHVYNSWGWFGFPLLYTRVIKTNVSCIFDLRSKSTKWKRWSTLGNALQRVASAWFDWRFAASRALGEEVFGNGGRPWSVAPIGVDSSLFVNTESGDRQAIRARLGLPISGKIFVFHGHMRRAKGILEIIDEFDMFLKRSARCGTWLLLIGGGPDLNRIKSYAGASCCAEKILVIGDVNHKAIPEYLSACDVGISYLPRDGHLDVQPPLKVLEFMMAGLPVLATWSVEHESLLEDYDAKILVRDRARGSLANGMERIVERLDGWGGRTREFCSDVALRWDWKIIVEKYIIPVYERLYELQSRSVR